MTCPISTCIANISYADNERLETAKNAYKQTCTK